MIDNLRTTESEELFWLSVRYVGDDLPDSDRLAFEERLAGDLQACEAVAAAVRLTAGVGSLEREPLVSSQQIAGPFSNQSSRRRWAPVAISAAMVLITGLLITWWNISKPPRYEVASAELVNRWRLDHHFRSAEDHDAEEFWDGESEILDESLSAPGWLVSAVQLTAKPNGPRP